MKILVVEDQESLAKLIKKGLKKEGYAVDYLTDGEAAQRRIESSSDDYDLVILDLMLPNRTGIEICRSIRERNIRIPVLILTAKGELESKITLLNMGADDYLVKPFEFKELLARIRAITRRPTNALPTELRFADVVLNPSTRAVSRNGKEIVLTLKEFRLLEYLMRRPNQAINREDLLSNIWDFDFDSFSNVLDVFINKLRDKVDKNHSKKLIETVWGIGYRLKD
ncbi:MAG: response regulator transcription factor [Candidatus Staskawiczbacteria bacterium]|jgi:DNA-binding response OmpR family regulator